AGDGRASRSRVRVTDRGRVRGEAAAAATPAEAQGPGNPRSTPEAELAAARKEAAEYRDHLMRLQAEFDNYRKRVLKEQTRALELAAEPIVRGMLGVLDAVELARMAAEPKPDLERVLDGRELV